VLVLVLVVVVVLVPPTRCLSGLGVLQVICEAKVASESGVLTINV
jgi:hypothetical protein